MASPAIDKMVNLHNKVMPIIVPRTCHIIMIWYNEKEGQL